MRIFCRRVIEPTEWLIVGLGNPGAEYSNTRHNIGFLVVEEVARQSGFKWKSSRYQCRTAQGKIDGHHVCLCKPTTFMNLSGNAVGPLSKALGVHPQHVVIISDDVDLPLGQMRLRSEGGSGGHNGHKSIIKALGTQAYPRVRIGVGRGSDQTKEHVLGNFSPSEFPSVRIAIDSCAAVVRTLVTQGIPAAQELSANLQKD